MRPIRTVGLCALAALALFAFASASASAALPELGRCVAVEGVKEGKKTVYHGKYKGKGCLKESAGGNTGKYEWLAGPGAEKAWENNGTNEPVTLETVAGTKVVCANHFNEGEYTSEKAEKVVISLRHCEDTAIHKPCQSFFPEEKNPTVEGQINSEPLTGELGDITTTGKPKVGWDFKPTTGPFLFVFECGTIPGAGTKVTVEGSFIGAVKPVDKMAEEFKDAYKAAGGKQLPEAFAGGEKDTLTATIVTGVESVTEQMGYAASAAEEISNEELLEIKAL